MLGAKPFAVGFLSGYSGFREEADYLTMWQRWAKLGEASIKNRHAVWNREGCLGNRVFLQQSRRRTACEDQQQEAAVTRVLKRETPNRCLRRELSMLIKIRYDRTS